MLRVIDSLQLVDRKPQIATPANWTVSSFIVGKKKINETQKIREIRDKKYEFFYYYFSRARK